MSLNLTSRASATVALVACLMGSGIGFAADMPKPDDAQITNAIQSKLTETMPNNAQSVHVTTQDGVVTLSGRASPDTQQKALEIAKGTPGVTDVKNRVMVRM